MGARRQGDNLAWSQEFTLPAGGGGRLETKAEEHDLGVRYTTSITSTAPMEITAIEFVADLPRDVFLKGRVTPEGATPVMLAVSKPADPALYRGQTSALRVEDPLGHVTLEIGFDRPVAVSVVDRWDDQGRSFQVRAAVQLGDMAARATAALTADLRLTNKAPAPPAARLKLDASEPWYKFDGFGGNYCWNNMSPVSAYTLKNLKVAWGRTEMKLRQWDKQRDNPGPEIRADMERMREFHRLGIPYVISIWWLPERLYTDPYEKTSSAHFRLIDPVKWDELLELVGSYLLYAKREYGVEPDLFSFNEANIGVYVGFTPEAHNEAIKRIGAYFEKLGLKTKMLLADATGPRDTHKFALAAASDPEALKYVGAVGFHTWGTGTPQHYKEWGDLAEWLNLPLLVTELGVDAAAYYTRSWDSYHYGLREAHLTQELLMYARPQGTQYWQFTNDYALAKAGPDGEVRPTPRFWLTKHFTNLTPQKSEALRTVSDQKSVLFTAFRKGNAYTLHILNMGAAREAILEGLPDGAWQPYETTETAHYQQKARLSSTGGTLTLKLPARSLVTLTMGQ
ncbi:MAG TPA: hypothetical protein PK157_07395 [Bryobacteraceae bacterium]|nr:hypothetical protein [Bryobacteraceae bacterium]